MLGGLIKIFSKPENPKEIALKCDETALLVIDVQTEFCDSNGPRGNRETEIVSDQIKSLVPAFRKAGIPVYVAYYSDDGAKEIADIDFYKFIPDEKDVLIPKNGDSAFDGTRLKKILKKKHKKTLLVCGFNENACVFKTIIDARRAGFNVGLLQDMSGNDNRTNTRTKVFLKDLRSMGTAMTSSKEALKILRAAGPCA